MTLTEPTPILLVEDNPGDARIIQLYFSEQIAPIFKFRHATRLHDAFGILKTETVGAVLLDLSLPDSSGLDTLRKLIAVNNAVPIVVLTGAHDERLGLQALESGAQDYLIKDEISAPLLFRSIRYSIERQRIRFSYWQTQEQLKGLAAIVETSDDDLRQSEERFRQMAESIREVFWMTDLDKNKMIYISPGYEEVWGRTCESLYTSPSNWADAIYVEDRERVLKNAYSKQSSGDYNEEYRIIRPDGSMRWIWDRAFPVKDATGRVYRVVGIAEDITESKKAREALGQEELRLRMIMEKIPAIVWSLDTNLVITSSIGLGLISLGLKPNEVIGMKLADYMGTDDPADPTMIAINRALSGEIVSLDSESKGMFFQSVFQPLRDLSGVIVGVSALTLNVTDRRQLEDQLRQSQKMEAVGKLAGGVAHDFNNILNVILGYTDIIAQGPQPSDTWLEDIEEIRRAAKRAASLTHQLLAFSRRQALQPRIFSLNDEINELERMLSRLLGENIIWIKDLSADLWLIKADPGQIQQVLINLAVNARDAMPNGGTLTIKTSNIRMAGSTVNSFMTPGDYVVLSVADTGVGMAEDVKAQVFEPFFTTKEKGKGTGLGLSLVYGVVRQSNGYIFVESGPGRGAEFAIYLPKIERDMDKAALPVEAPRRRRGSGTILVVEDEDSVQKLISRVLSNDGFKVLLASNAKQAMDLMTEFNGELSMILTDIVLPDLRGDELVKLVGGRYPELKIIFMSGYLDNDFGRFNIDENTPFLQKPFSSEALTSKVRGVLNDPFQS